MARFTRFKASRDAMLFGWAVLGEDFLSDGVTAPVFLGGWTASADTTADGSASADVLQDSAASEDT